MTSRRPLGVVAIAVTMLAACGSGSDGAVLPSSESAPDIDASQTTVAAVRTDPEPTPRQTDPTSTDSSTTAPDAEPTPDRTDPATTDAPSADAPTSTDVSTTSTPPTTTAATTPTPPLAPDRSDCSEPLAPPSLVGGGAVGDGESGADDSITWGSGPDAVTQFVGAEIDADLVMLAQNQGRIRTAGDLTSAVIPIGDPPNGVIQVLLLDDAFDCDRQYIVGPGVSLDDALTFAESLVGELA